MKNFCVSIDAQFVEELQLFLSKVYMYFIATLDEFLVVCCVKQSCLKMMFKAILRSITLQQVNNAAFVWLHLRTCIGPRREGSTP